ncbi:MAG: tRNA-intron lyase [Euryarchaeota archaeon]|nr:tRNA-intron lyase [Euryarchaeota archaeon]
MEGVIEGRRVRLLSMEGLPEGWGTRESEGVQVSLEEAAVLVERGLLEVKDGGSALDLPGFLQVCARLSPRFIPRYVVFRNFRERGYAIQPGPLDFRLYPRGSKPGEKATEAYVRALSEREPLEMREVARWLEEAGNVRKRLLLAVVDEEGDTTFYEARWTEPPRRPWRDPPSVVRAQLLPDRGIVWDEAAGKSLHESLFYGRPDRGRLVLSLVEVGHLLGQGFLELQGSNGTPLSLDQFLERAGEVEPHLREKLRLYSDLRGRGLVVRTGYKFGTHFRVYEKYPEPHSKYLAHAVAPDRPLPLGDLSRAVRLAASVRKHLLLACPQGAALRYLEITRVRP